jgi:hypothetical protein
MAAEEGSMNPLSARLLLVFLAVAAADAAFTQSLRRQPLLLGTSQLDLSRSTYFSGTATAQRNTNLHGQQGTPAYDYRNRLRLI